MIAFAGQKIKNTVKKTYTLVYEVTLCFPFNNESPHIKTIETNILLLGHIVRSRSANITASGFFRIDYSLLFVVLSANASIVLILLQFKGYDANSSENKSLYNVFFSSNHSN